MPTKSEGLKGQKIAVIIGAGPAGLTAAHELLKRTDIKPIIFEKSGQIGGISRTVDYKGNKIDIGGHRFFSKSDKVMEWWNKILPIPSLIQESVPPNKSDLNPDDKTMLVRDRKSRIFFNGKLFGYPITLNFNTLSNLGLIRIVRIFASYLKIKILPIKSENTLEDFYINRFGKELYLTFFKSYTEKVWGVSCREIPPDWGAQRVKGLSLAKTIFTAIKNAVMPEKLLSQKGIETSLIQKFLYPKFGPGQMWSEVAEEIKKMGGEIILNTNVAGIDCENGKVTGVEIKNEITGETKTLECDFCFSTMPVKELVSSVRPAVPKEIFEAADSLEYRDFMIIGILLDKIKLTDDKTKIISDNWIYVQEPGVKVGRIQIFNNWSPYLVADANKIWIGAEYFVNEGDELWNKPDEEFKNFAAEELTAINFIDKNEVRDGVVIRVAKAYPSYTGGYVAFPVIRKFLDKIDNLFLVGRNGMHRYNNQDHSMLTAMAAVDNIIGGIKSKENIWAVNSEEEYHEERRKN